MANVDDLRIDGPIPRPRRRGPSPTPWVLAVALAAFAWWMLGRPLPKIQLPAALQSATGTPAPAGEATPGASASPDASSPGAALAVASAPAGSFSAGGYVEVIPPGPLAVSPLFPGKIIKLHCKPGDSVAQGQLLAELDSSLLRQEAAVLQARVDLAASQLKLSQAGFRDEELLDAQAAVDRAQARLTRAQADAAREGQLYEAGVSPRATYDAAQAELGQAQAELASAAAMLKLKQSGTRHEEIGISQSSLGVARAELSRIQQQIGQCRIKSPVGGVVYEIEVPEGGWVDPSSGGEAKSEILRLFDPAALQAYADVNQRDSSRVSVGQAVELTTDAHPGEPIAGIVERIMPQANLQRNTVRVIIAIPSVPGYLKPEMNLKVSFLADDSDSGATASGRDSADGPEDAARDARATDEEGDTP